jgi:pyruvate formate lyase activating enzyme
VNFEYSYVKHGVSESDVKVNRDNAKRYFASVKESGCDGIAFSISEATIFGELLISLIDAAKKIGLVSILCTNGMFSESMRKDIASRVDLIRFDWKGLGRKGFAATTGVNGFELCSHNFISITRAPRSPWLEFAFCPIPGVNDSRKEAIEFAKMIIESGNPPPPLRLLRFAPSARMGHVNIPTLKYLLDFRDVLIAAGYPFVYVERDIDEESVSTDCPSCHSIIIERSADGARGSATCGKCGIDWSKYFHCSMARNLSDMENNAPLQNMFQQRKGISNA